MKNLKMAIAIICVLAMVFSITGCSEDQGYRFEAEHAIITDGTGMWNPITGVGIDVSGSELARVDGLANISDGSSLTWKITSDKATTAAITLRAASHRRDWMAEEPKSIGIDDVSKALALTVNGAAVAVSGSIPGGAYLSEDVSKGALAYHVADITVTVDLVAGENIIVFTALGTTEEYNFFMDCLIVETDAELTFTETDNSDRVWGM